MSKYSDVATEELVTTGISDYHAGKQNNWVRITEIAKRLLAESPVTLTVRRLYYETLSLGLFANNPTAYGSLDRAMSKDRKKRPEDWTKIHEEGRSVERKDWQASAEDALERTLKRFGMDDRRGQRPVMLMTEKAALLQDLRVEFRHQGYPITSSKGNCSLTLLDTISEWATFERSPVIAYMGDFDPPGMKIRDDLEANLPKWVEWVDVGLTADQVAEYALPSAPFDKDWSPRLEAQFCERHDLDEAMQVEADALGNEAVVKLFREAVEPFTDAEIAAQNEAEEEEEKEKLRKLIG